MSVSVRSVIGTGTNGMLVDVECNISNNLPSITIVGSASKAVDEARERVRGAFASSDIQLPRKRITINLAPADMPKNDSGLDLAIATSILSAGEQVHPNLQKTIFMGELGLDGSVKPIRGIIGKLRTAQAEGYSACIIPSANLPQAKLVPGLTIIGTNTLRELYEHLSGAKALPAIKSEHGDFDTPNDSSDTQVLGDIIGQELAKRALEIAAAGGHNVFFSGPPGTGKTMLARALPSLLPPLSHEEVLEVTQLHSLTHAVYDKIITTRPFRAPHHSASHVAVIGGGHNLRPGEISLSHRGVLFMDELPEFNRLTLESLRQPLEDKHVTVARAKETVEYPAEFILIATANPCPCGYFGTSKPCTCLPHAVSRYQQKMSGPIMDRIDLYANVHEVDHANLLSVNTSKPDQTRRESVARARKLQASRLGANRLNASMKNAEIKRTCNLTPEAKTLLDTAAAKLDISARAYMRIVKVARTIADLADSDTIEIAHITEALQYRRPDPARQLL